MKQGQNILVLAGSAEARSIAQHLRAEGANVRALISEPTRGVEPLPVPCHLLDFEDVAEVRAHLRGVDLIMDASHGFDARMSAVGHALAAEKQLPFLTLRRPGWVLPADADGHDAPDVGAAMALIPAGARVFSATGWASLPQYAGFPGARLLLRQTTAHDRLPPFDFVELVFGDAPFDVPGECALFERLGVDVLICRNLGGRASYPKVAAALTMGIRIILIDRPPLPDGVEVVTDVAGALAWIAAQ